MVKALILIPDESVIKNNQFAIDWWQHILPCNTIEDLQDFIDFVSQYKIGLYLYIKQDLVTYIDPILRKYHLSIDYIIKKSGITFPDIDQVMDDCKSELVKIKLEDIRCLCSNRMAHSYDLSNPYALISGHNVLSYEGFYQLKKIILDSIDEDE